MPHSAATSSVFKTIVTTVLGVVLGIVQSVGAQIVSFWTAYGAQIMSRRVCRVEWPAGAD